MTEVSAKSLQTFVAGAMALLGFQALLSIPSFVFASPHRFLAIGIISGLISGLALPIGVGILFGHVSALRWAAIYLWLYVICDIAAICASLLAQFHVLPAAIKYFGWSSLSMILTPFLLCWLFTLSRSTRFQSNHVA